MLVARMIGHCPSPLSCRAVISLSTPLFPYLVFTESCFDDDTRECRNCSTKTRGDSWKRAPETCLPLCPPLSCHRAPQAPPSFCRELSGLQRQPRTSLAPPSLTAPPYLASSPSLPQPVGAQGLGLANSCEAQVTHQLKLSVCPIMSSTEPISLCSALCFAFV
jgi:hypothetical protein